jgi:hypothetical protein
MPFASHSQQNTIASGSPVCFMQHILIIPMTINHGRCHSPVATAWSWKLDVPKLFGAMEFIDSLVSQRILAACLASVDNFLRLGQI